MKELLWIASLTTASHGRCPWQHSATARLRIRQGKRRDDRRRTADKKGAIGENNFKKNFRVHFSANGKTRMTATTTTTSPVGVPAPFMGLCVWGWWSLRAERPHYSPSVLDCNFRMPFLY